MSRINSPSLYSKSKSLATLGHKLYSVILLCPPSFSVSRYRSSKHTFRISMHRPVTVWMLYPVSLS
ncbi:hypothetical protein HanXRQr2_Chr05g0211431 [Helianthus annuus]|uniref:Uncharacterized protein n=1 Tax=Helianthus annuus TaxID=4232 RepID=A0A9K3IYQ7_HELAN|nr:hypothetical protein HanXRQr2_Chr05g0211431 [Helianthus annuus]